MRNHDILPIKRDKCETFGYASVKAITIIQKPSLELSSKTYLKVILYCLEHKATIFFFFAFYFYKVNLLHSRFRLIKRTLKTQCLKKSRKCLILSKLCWFWHENCYRFWWTFLIFKWDFFWYFLNFECFWAHYPKSLIFILKLNFDKFEFLRQNWKSLMINSYKKNMRWILVPKI